MARNLLNEVVPWSPTGKQICADYELTNKTGEDKKHHNNNAQALLRIIKKGLR